MYPVQDLSIVCEGAMSGCHDPGSDSMPRARTSIKDIITGTLQLSRIKEVADDVCALSLLGTLLAGHHRPLSQVILALVGSLLAGTFFAMFNDVEDAEDDARNERKAARNPVAAGRLGKRYAYAASAVMAAGALCLYSLTSPATFGVGVSLVVVGFLYSWRPVRLKALVALDLLSHGYFLAAGIMLAGYFATARTVSSSNVLVAALAVSLISMGSDLYNEIRDFDTDRKARLMNTAALLGLPRAKLMRTTLTLLGLSLIVYVTVEMMPALHMPSVVAGLAAGVMLLGHGCLTGTFSLAEFNDRLTTNVLLFIVSAVLAISIVVK